MIRKSWIFWYIIKFKDSYFVLLCGKLIKNLLTRMKLTTLQTLWKLDYLKFFWNYLDINYLFQSICNLGVLCGFNTMPCVISQWSPYLVSVVFVTTESNLGQCPFILDDAFFPATHGGEEIPWLCVDEAAAHGAKRPYARDVLFDTLSLLPMAGEKNLKGMSEATIRGAKKLHTREDNIMSIVNRWIP